jgi:hypothetical protein
MSDSSARRTSLPDRASKKPSATVGNNAMPLKLPLLRSLGCLFQQQNNKRGMWHFSGVGLPKVPAKALHERALMLAAATNQGTKE